MKNANETIANETSINEETLENLFYNADLSGIERLALENEFDNTAYHNHFNNWVNTGLNNWFVELSNEDLQSYTVSNTDVQQVMDAEILEHADNNELYNLCLEQAKKLLIASLNAEKNRR